MCNQMCPNFLSNRILKYQMKFLAACLLGTNGKAKRHPRTNYSRVPNGFFFAFYKAHNLLDAHNCFNNHIFIF